MRITVIGTGYVGLVSGVCFAEIGHDVICVDKDQHKLSLLEQGRSPIYEPGLDELMEGSISDGRLSFTDDLKTAVTGADVVFIAVGTPTRKSDGSADLTYVYTAASEVAAALNGYTVVVTKSTVPVGTNRQVKQIIEKVAPDADFDVVSNPEFLREGAAIGDFLAPDRIVVGVETDKASNVMADCYRPLTDRGYPLISTDLESAEVIKYSANAFLATKITFINEIAALCESVGADVRAVAHGMGTDTRIGDRFLQAGPGYGGSCFPKDTLALARTAQQNGIDMPVLGATIRSNGDIKRRMVQKIEDLCPDGFAGKRIAVFGVTFKAGTDDMRDAPALTIVPALVGRGADVRITDPQGAHHGRALLPGASWHADPYEAAKNADLIVVLTEWDMFKTLNLEVLANNMRTPNIADLRNLYNANDLQAAGFTGQTAIGRAAVIVDPKTTSGAVEDTMMQVAS